MSAIDASISSVLWDWDDTLLDSYEARIRALQAAFDAEGIASPTAADFVRDAQGRELGRAFDELQASRGAKTDLLANYRRLYWARSAGNVRLFPGVRQLLERLHAAGIGMAVVTQKARDIELDGLRRGAVHEASDVGVAGLMGAFVGYEDVANPKPHPEPVQLAMERLGAHPKTTLMVGDTAADMLAGQAAGCWTCHATWGTSPEHEALDGVTPHMRASRPEELLLALRFAGA